MSKVIIFATLFIASGATMILPPRVQAFPETGADRVTLVGQVSCSKCQGIQPLRKGYTRWTWALHSVDEGDDMVLVVGGNTYKLEGERNQLLKYMESKAKVTGILEGGKLTVQAITATDKKK